MSNTKKGRKRADEQDGVQEVVGQDEYLNDIGEEVPFVESTADEPVTSVTEPAASEPVSDGGDVESRVFVDPLIEENVDTKAYAKGMTGEIPSGDIPVAKFSPPKNIVDDSKKDVQQIPQSAKIEPLNAEVETMSETEKKAGAELSVASFWSGYEKINMFMGMLLQFPIEKRIEMHNEDKLDLNMQVKVSIDGSMVTVNEFYEQYNIDVKEVFTVDPELKKRLDEPMKREAMRLGLVMSDKQTILLGMGEDITTKIVQAFSIKKAMSNFSKSMIDQYAQQKQERKAEAERQVANSNLIDPESEEGQRAFYEFYKKMKAMESNDVERAKATSDLFNKEVEITADSNDKRDDVLVVESESIDENGLVVGSNTIDKEL
jgi:hypothetical protein